jgi:hypothetical protein
MAQASSPDYVTAPQTTFQRKIDHRSGTFGASNILTKAPTQPWRLGKRNILFSEFGLSAYI